MNNSRKRLYLVLTAVVLAAVCICAVVLADAAKKDTGTASQQFGKYEPNGDASDGIFHDVLEDDDSEKAEEPSFTEQHYGVELENHARYVKVDSRFGDTCFRSSLGCNGEYRWHDMNDFVIEDTALVERLEQMVLNMDFVEIDHGGNYILEGGCYQELTFWDTIYPVNFTFVDDTGLQLGKFEFYRYRHDEEPLVEVDQNWTVYFIASIGNPRLIGEVPYSELYGSYIATPDSIDYALLDKCFDELISDDRAPSSNEALELCAYEQPWTESCMIVPRYAANESIVVTPTPAPEMTAPPKTITRVEYEGECRYLAISFDLDDLLNSRPMLVTEDPEFIARFTQMLGDMRFHKLTDYDEENDFNPRDNTGYRPYEYVRCFLYDEAGWPLMDFSFYLAAGEPGSGLHYSHDYEWSDYVSFNNASDGYPPPYVNPCPPRFEGYVMIQNGTLNRALLQEMFDTMLRGHTYEEYVELVDNGKYESFTTEYEFSIFKVENQKPLLKKPIFIEVE
ncbi:MAG: hypothetical protein J1E60_03270 [Christensenellaceae bacterium]|nr:hypothetical protein [Christensenellaceae bacterium]